MKYSIDFQALENQSISAETIQEIMDALYYEEQKEQREAEQARHDIAQCMIRGLSH